MRTLAQSSGRWLRLSLLSYRALFSWLNPLDYLTIKILEPIAQLLFFTFLGQFAGFDPAYFALGNAVRLASISGLYGSVMVMMEERMSGTLPLVIASATPMGQTIVTRVALQGLDGLLTTALGLTVSFLFLGLDASAVQWLWLLPALLITVYAIAALGLFVSIFGVFGVDLGFVMNFVYTLLILFCGVNFSITLLPPALQFVAHLLPLTHGLLAIRAIVAGDLINAPFYLLLECSIGCGYGISGYLLFRYAEYRARVQGTLDLI